MHLRQGCFADARSATKLVLSALWKAIKGSSQAHLHFFGICHAGFPPSRWERAQLLLHLEQGKAPSFPS